MDKHIARVTFQRRRSGRVWVALFDMGSEAANNEMILREAWNTSSAIVAVEAVR